MAENPIAEDEGPTVKTLDRLLALVSVILKEDLVTHTNIFNGPHLAHPPEHASRALVRELVDRAIKASFETFDDQQIQRIYGVFLAYLHREQQPIIGE